MQGGGGGIGGQSHADRTSKFNYKSFTRMEKFSGNANEWSGWAFNLKVCADAMDDEFGEALHQVTKTKMEKEDVDASKSVVSRKDLSGPLRELENRTSGKYLLEGTGIGG